MRLLDHNIIGIAWRGADFSERETVPMDLDVIDPVPQPEVRELYGSEGRRAFLEARNQQAARAGA